MKPRVDVLTLAVADLGRALAFYRDGLGLPTEGVIGEQWAGDEQNASGAAAMFELDGGLILALYPDLAKDADIPRPAPQSGAFSIGQLVDSREAVDELLVRAEAAGATLLEPARVAARTSPPGARGSSSRTITSSITSPRVAIRTSYNRSMDEEDRAARLRSFLIGGLVGASAAVATARRRRDLARRRRERRLHPAGLAAFEEAPCFQELLEQERELDG